VEPNNLKDTKLGSLSWERGPDFESHGELQDRIQSMLRAAEQS
jgi:hypothetical protein